MDNIIESRATKWRRITNKKGLARHLGVTTRCLDNWRLHKNLPEIKIGKIVRFDLDQIDAWLDDAVEKQIKEAKQRRACERETRAARNLEAWLSANREGFTLDDIEAWLSANREGFTLDDIEAWLSAVAEKRAALKAENNEEWNHHLRAKPRTSKSECDHDPPSGN